MKAISYVVLAVTTAAMFTYLSLNAGMGSDHAINFFQMPAGFEKNFALFMFTASSLAVGVMISMFTYYGTKAPLVILGLYKEEIDFPI